MTDELKALVEQTAQTMFTNRSLYRLLRWEDAGDLTKDMWRRDALAAIRCVAEATREASEGMLDVAENTLPHSAVPIWRALHAASVLGEAIRDAD